MADTLTPVEPVSVPAPASTPEPPANVILIIGDGMDDQQITMARNYLVGTTGRLRLDQMPMRGAVQIITLDENAPSKSIYVADSANSATSMATGVATSRGRIATTAGTDLDIPTIAEQVKAAGGRVGIVTTASVTDATPASFISHISIRMCEDPVMMVDALIRDRIPFGCPDDLKSNGGLGSISEQIADSDYDIILGGGAEHFARLSEDGSQSLFDRARQNGFQIMSSVDDLSGRNPESKVLGLFSLSTMPVRWRGEGGRIAELPEPSFLNRVSPYLGSATLPEPMKCENNPAFDGMPTLAQMTDAALSHLSRGTEEKTGFFLMIESASIDKESHARNPCGQIGELDQLNEALEAALAFAAANERTLVLVTADHGQAAQIIPTESLFAAFDVPIYSPGHIARLTLDDGGVMTINYATNRFPIAEHTGVNVPIFGNEPALGTLPTLLTQPELYQVMANHLGLPDAQ